MSRVAWVACLVSLGVAASAGAGPAAKPTAPHVRLQPLATLDSLQPAGPGAWSSRGTWLALRRGTSEIWVVDAASPRTPPRLLFDAGQWVRSVSWSPDGSWLLLLIGDASPTNDRMLVAVPRDGGAPDTLRRNADIL